MKFSEAREKAEKGDILKLSVPGPGLGYFITEIKVGFNHYFNITWEQYDSCDWQIIPAEPVVLSADYIRQECLKKTDVSKHNDYGWETELIKAGHQNGRLERDLELRKFLEFFKYFYKNMNNVILNDLVELYKNLPPLNKNEE